MHCGAGQRRRRGSGSSGASIAGGVKERLPCFILQGGEDKTGALSWQGVGPQDTSSCYGGGATATQALCSSSSREMQGQLCPARARAFHAPVTHAPFRPDPNHPLPSRADLNFTQEAAETKSYHIHRHHRLSVSQPCSDSLLPSPQGHWCGETEQEMSKPPPLLPAAMHPSSSHLEGGGLGSDVTESQWEQSTLGIEGLTVCWAVAFEACPATHTPHTHSG